MCFDTWNLNSMCLVERVHYDHHSNFSVTENRDYENTNEILFPNYLRNNTGVILCTWFQDAADHCIYLSKAGVSVFPSDKLGPEIFCNN